MAHNQLAAAILLMACVAPARASAITVQDAPIVQGPESQALVQETRERAENGDPVEQYTLGLMHATGQGVPQDEEEAVVWFRKSADQGFAPAQFNLGVAYAQMRGVPKRDDELAVTWYRRAADQGFAPALSNLGVMYTNGRGVPQDFIEAHKWFDLAASYAYGVDPTPYVEARDALAKRMTPEEITDAQQRASAWQQAEQSRP